MQMHTVPVTKADGTVIQVTVLATDTRSATIMAIKAHGPDPLVADAIDTVAFAQFRTAWPTDVRKVLVRAAKHEGDLPPYATKQVAWAIKQAGFVETRMLRQEAQAEEVLKNLPAAERNKVGV